MDNRKVLSKKKKLHVDLEFQFKIFSVKANKILNPNDYSLDILNKLAKTQNKLNEFIDKAAKTTDNVLNQHERNLNETSNLLKTFKAPKDVASAKPETSHNHHNVDAKDEKFLNEFYGKSRLHLISTLASDLKIYINNFNNQ